MGDQQPIAWLMFFTLSAGVAIAGGALLYFLRSRYNRAVAGHALIGEDKSTPGPTTDGALPEILGVLALAVMVMGLLLLGYASR